MATILHSHATCVVVRTRKKNNSYKRDVTNKN